MSARQTFNIVYRQTEYRSARVEAASEREARRLFRDGQYEDHGFEHAEGARIVSIEVAEKS